MSEPDRVLLSLPIPKAAGTTLDKVIYRQYSDPSAPTDPDLDLWEGVLYYPGHVGFFKDLTNQPPPTVKTALERYDVRAVHGHFSFGIHQLTDRDCTYLSMLREPVGRVTSLYYHVKRSDWRPDWQERFGGRH